MNRRRAMMSVLLLRPELLKITDPGWPRLAGRTEPTGKIQNATADRVQKAGGQHAPEPERPSPLKQSRTVYGPSTSRRWSTSEGHPNTPQERKPRKCRPA